MKRGIVVIGGGTAAISLEAALMACDVMCAEPYIEEDSYEIQLSRLSDEWEKETFLEKEVKSVPHYRDIEFKYKKRRH